MCPNCGYCKHCGRGNYFSPWIVYHPVPTWVYIPTVTNTGTTSVGDSITTRLLKLSE